MASVLIEKLAHKPQLQPNPLCDRKISNDNNIKNNNDGQNNYELLEVIADLLVQKKITENRISLQIKEKKGNRLVIGDLARNLHYEVWWHDNRREGAREMMMHRLLREHPIPNLLIADFDFKFNGRNYLLRQKDCNEFSLAEYLNAGENRSIELSFDDVMRGIQTLYEIQRRSKEPGIISETKPVHIYTHYSADRTIIMPNKERGYDFKYEITNEISVLAKYSGDNIAEVFYPADFEYDCQYSVYQSMAAAAKLAGAAPEIVERIHKKGLNCVTKPLPIDDILTGKSKSDNYHYVYQSSPYSPIDIKHPENAEQYLEHLADLMMQHNVLQARPVFRIMEQDSYRHRVADQNDNWFEIAWQYGQKEEILKDLAIHRILREEKVPHLITAEFGFEYENVSWLVFRYYHRGLSLYNAYPAKIHLLQLKDVLKAVRQLYQLFSRYIVPIDQICAARPLSVKTRMFSAQNLWLIPDGKGSYDFKFIVNYSYSVMKLTDDGAGILIYENDSFSEAHFPAFSRLGTVAEHLGYEELGQLISDLDPYQADFEEIYNVINRCDSIST